MGTAGIDRGLPTARLGESNARGRFGSRPFVRGRSPRTDEGCATLHATRAGEHRRRIALRVPREHRVVHRPAPSPPRHPRALSRESSLESRLPTRALANRRRPRDDHARRGREAGARARHVRLAGGVQDGHQHRDPPRLPQPHHEGAWIPVQTHPAPRPGSLADGRSLAFFPRKRTLAPARPADRERPPPQEHPDKGGDAVKFKRIQRAYEFLSDPEKRSHYDATGEVERSVEEELLETFGGGAFRDTGRDRTQMEKESLADAIVSQEKQKVRRVRPVRSVDARTRPRLNTG